MSPERDEMAITFDMVENFRVAPEFGKKEHRRTATKMLVSKRGISMPAVRDDLADRAYRFRNQLGTKTLLNAVCTNMSSGCDEVVITFDMVENYRFPPEFAEEEEEHRWNFAVIYQARILYILEKPGSANITVRFKEHEYERCPSPEDTVDNNPVEDGVLSSSSPSSVVAERDDEEKRGQGDDKHKDKEKRKDRANEERVENGKEEGEEKERDQRRHGEEEMGGSGGSGDRGGVED